MEVQWMVNKMTLEEAIRIVREKCPFEDYINPAKGAYLNITQTVMKYLEPPARILDFGAGLSDKTAVLAVLGFDCSACDDLQDHWHKLPGNREKIVQFATDYNINFHLMEHEADFPYQKDEFDMVMMHDILEHIHDSPRDVLNDLLEFLKPGGYLFITVPNAANLMKRVLLGIGRTNLPSFDSYYWYPSSWRGHIREYVKDDLIKLTNYLDLDRIELHGCHNNLISIPRPLRPVWLVLTRIITSGCDNWLLVAQKKEGWQSRKYISEEELRKIMKRYIAYKY